MNYFHRFNISVASFFSPKIKKSVNENMESAMAKNSVEPIREHNDTNENNGCHVQLFSKSEITGNQLYSNLHHTGQEFRVIDEMKNDRLLCDVKLLTDDGSEIEAHKIILAGCSPYFYAMFTNFEERNQNCIKIHGIDFSTLELLIQYVYTAQVKITEENVESLLSAANLLQLTDARDVCCDFLRAQLHHTNCLGIRAFADAHGCSELVAYAHKYMEKYFSEVVEGDEFLKLALEQVRKLISSDRVDVSSEEEIFECVISWVNADLENRRSVLVQLMKHVRLPLLSREYLLHHVKEEPLFKNNPECEKLYIEAIKHHHLKRKKKSQLNNPRMKPRRPSKVLLFFAVRSMKDVWYYDFEDETFYQMRDLPVEKGCAKLVVLRNRTYLVGGSDDDTSRHTIDVYDDVSDQWSTCTEMKFVRRNYGVAALHDCIYVVGGGNGKDIKSSNLVEAYNPITNEWRKISPMLKKRSQCNVEVLDGYLYVGGNSSCWESEDPLWTFECYNRKEDKWKAIPEMTTPRGISNFAILDKTFYLLGNSNQQYLTDDCVAYNPKTKQWNSIADKESLTGHGEVAAFNGKLYVAGSVILSKFLILRVYSPKTNSWMNLVSCLDKNRYNSRIAVIGKPLSSPIAEIRKTKKVSMFPLGFGSSWGLSTPILRNGLFEGYFDEYAANRKYRIDLSGFAVNVAFLLQRPNAKMPFEAGCREDGFVKSLEPLGMNEVDFLANQCTRIYVWNTFGTREVVNADSYKGTSIDELVKQL